jgi:hypothetical protein
MVTKNFSNPGSHGNPGGKAKWSAAVATDSTHPRSGLFNRDAKSIARELASRHEFLAAIRQALGETVALSSFLKT